MPYVLEAAIGSVSVMEVVVRIAARQGQGNVIPTTDFGAFLTGFLVGVRVLLPGHRPELSRALPRRVLDGLYVVSARGSS